MILDASEDLANKHAPESLPALIELFLSIRIYTAQWYKAKPHLCAPGICCCTWHGAARWLIRSLASEVQGKLVKKPDVTDGKPERRAKHDLHRFASICRLLTFAQTKQFQNLGMINNQSLIRLRPYDYIYIYKFFQLCKKNVSGLLALVAAGRGPVE